MNDQSKLFLLKKLVLDQVRVGKANKTQKMFLFETIDGRARFRNTGIYGRNVG